jgi:hypothetical protein
MDKSKKIILVVGVIAIVVLLVLLLSLVGKEPAQSETEDGKPEQPLDTTGSDLSSIEAVQLNPPDNYIQQLKDIIENDPDPYARETALLALTEIAMRKNSTGEIVDYLKNIAMDEEDENVRTSAYVSIDLIRDRYPLEPKGSLELSIEGEIKKRADITFIATVASTSATTGEAMVGITSLHNNIELLSDKGTLKFLLNANELKEARFDLRLLETGEYYVPVVFMMSFDSVDYEKIKKEVRLIVNEADGEFTVLG